MGQSSALLCSKAGFPWWPWWGREGAVANRHKRGSGILRENSDSSQCAHQLSDAVSGAADLMKPFYSFGNTRGAEVRLIPTQK